MADLGALFTELAKAKAREAEAKAQRQAIEDQIAAAVEDAPERGSRTLKADDGVRCTVKFDRSYKANVEALRNLELPGDAPLPLKLKPASWVLDERAYEALSASHPEAFARVAAHVESKPSRPSLTLKL